MHERAECFDWRTTDTGEKRHGCVCHVCETHANDVLRSMIRELPPTIKVNMARFGVVKIAHEPREVDEETKRPPPRDYGSAIRDALSHVPML